MFIRVEEHGKRSDKLGHYCLPSIEMKMQKIDRVSLGIPISIVHSLTVVRHLEKLRWPCSSLVISFSLILSLFRLMSQSNTKLRQLSGSQGTDECLESLAWLNLPANLRKGVSHLSREIL